jgi:serine/threonine protein phosphatase PrpC
MERATARFETGAATHVGKVRQRNEDSYLVRPETGIWAVADGMGGHDGGDLASHTVIEALKSIQPPRSAEDLLSLCQESIFDANARLKEIGRQRGGAIIGTTVTVLLAFDGYFACVWSGDSRLYMVRDGKITQLSRDHTEVQELLQSGTITQEEARTWPGSNVITRAIGVEDAPELEMTSGSLNAGDVFVMCSDGLIRHVEDDEILNCVSANVSQQACDRLIVLTLERGALDNVTVVVVRYRPGHEPPSGPNGKSLAVKESPE